jgi:L-aspartate oxidase
MPRYLVQFNPKQTPHFFTDILIIGAGIAGLRAALAVPRSCDVLVVTKDKIQQSNSSYAQGGIAGVLSPEDRFENHIEDTLTAGGGLCHRDVVEMVVREAPAQIATLIDWGTHFDEEHGQLALTREGGHSHRRIVHALGDATGFEVMRAIIERARQTSNLTLWDDTFILDLLTHEGRCVGALLARPGQGKLLVWAKQTILASGGAGMVYRETTNPPVATGDGMAAAYRAGAELRDMEFMQFHPTVLYVAGSSRFLISEAVRGEGAYLCDKNLERFMLKVDPRAELAPRDIVAQAIFRQMEKTRHPNVYLDLRHLDPVLVHKRFPGIDKVCRGFGLDITTDLIPIRPGAHNMIGADDPAGPLGRRRGHLQRAARRQSARLQQLA